MRGRRESRIDTVTSPYVLEDWEIIETPGEGKLDQSRRAAPHEWSVARSLIADTAVVGREILRHHAAVVQKVTLEQTAQGAWHQPCRRRAVADGPPSGNPLESGGRTLEIERLVFG